MNTLVKKLVRGKYWGLSILMIPLGIPPSVGLGQTILVNDPTFQESDWSLKIDSMSSPEATASFGQVLNEGDPGPCMRIDYEVQAITPPSGSGLDNIAIQFVLLSSATSYSPQVQGPLETFRFSASARSISGWNPLSFAVFQDNVMYRTTPTVTPSLSDFQTEWTTAGRTFYSADEFGNPASRPNFSSTGSPIQFGVILSIGSSGNIPPSAFELDNFQVAIVPEIPAAALFSAVGLAGFATVRKLSRRKSVWGIRWPGPRGRVGNPLSLGGMGSTPDLCRFGGRS